MKTITRLPNLTNHSLNALRGATSPRVDRDRGIIFGAALIQLGDVNDERTVYVDEVTLQQTVKLSKSRTNGQKARFTHPNMSNDGLGKFLGRWKNHRKSEDGRFVIADLHIASMARKGRDSRGEYVLDMAEQEPDMFGVSLAPRWDEAAMKKEKRSDGKMPLRFLSIAAADVVDEPAATRGGFFGDDQLSIATAPHQATLALDRLFAEADSEVIRSRCLGFVDMYLANRFGCHHPKGELAMSEPQAAAGLSRDEVQAIVTKSLEAPLAAMTKELAALTAKADDTPDPAEQLSQQDILDERKRSKEMYALAKNAGLASWEQTAEQWIDKGLSVTEAKAAIADLAIAQNGLSKDPGDNTENPEAKYKAEYQKNAAAFAQMGLSQQDYILSRKVEDGKELLAAGTSA